MKNSKEITATVLEKRDEHLKNSIIRQQKIKKIACIGSTVCVCIIFVVGVIHFNGNDLKPPDIPDYSIYEPIQSSTTIAEKSANTYIQTNNKNNTSESTKSTKISQTLTEIISTEKTNIDTVPIITNPVTEITKQSTAYTDISTANTTVSTTEDEIVTEPKWNEMTLTQQFPEFAYNNNVYGLRNVTIQNEYVGNCIDNLTLSAIDYTSNKECTITGNLYEIKGISDTFSVALKFENCSSYYVYFNWNYVPNDLGMLLDDLNIENTLVLGDMYTDKNIPISNYSKEKVIDSLLNNRECECINDDVTHKNIVSFSANINLLGIENKYIALTEDGYITTNITEWRTQFYVSESAINELCELLGVYDVDSTEIPNPTEIEFAPE